MLNAILNMLVPGETGAREKPIEPDALHVAVCVLLVETASADDEFHESERQQICRALQGHFGLSAEEVEELLEYTLNHKDHSHDLWKFTNHINKSCNRPEKMAIVEEVWRVIFADGQLDGHEDYLVHKLAKLLNLPHPALIEAKMTVRKEQRDS